ncbi:MAG: M50 family metallopeptidase [Patescibacteria group bacterium]|nr:M50 family metallopeptidase [Patescibacteria group bacterium]
MNFLTVIVFILIFSILVLGHELGHFWAARRAGVKVEEFGIGLPPRIWGKRQKDMIWSINWIPFGGFVRVKGEGGENAADSDSLGSKSYGARALFTTGGVLMNFLIAYLGLVIGFWLGMPPLATDVSSYIDDQAQVASQVLVVQVGENSPALSAGVAAGDIILSVNGQLVNTAEELQAAINAAGQATLVINRAGEELGLSVATTMSEGRHVIGILADELVEKVHYVWWKVPYFALVELWRLISAIAVAIVGILASLVKSASLPDTIAGPVGIAKLTAQAVRLGFLSVLQFLIFLSVNLGLINIVPFPALDGGRLAFLVAEMIRGGKKVKPVVENAIHSLGFLLLLAFIFAVTYKDIVKLF